MSDPLCGRCSKPVNEDETLSLWDGEDYCVECVESVSTELADYARSHDALEELAPFDRQAHWRRARRMVAGCFVLFTPFYAITGYQDRGLVGIVFGCLLTAVACLAAGAILSPLGVWKGWTKRPWLRVKQGRVEYGRGEEEVGRRVRSATLRETSWRMGHSLEDSALRSTLAPRQEVVLMAVPAPSSLLPFRVERYACGWSEEMRRIWAGFLILADVSIE